MMISSRSESFLISSITLHELEYIKNASNKDPDVKYAARHLLNELDTHSNNYGVVVYKEEFNKYIKRELDI